RRHYQLSQLERKLQAHVGEYFSLWTVFLPYNSDYIQLLSLSYDTLVKRTHTKVLNALDSFIIVLRKGGIFMVNKESISIFLLIRVVWQSILLTYDHGLTLRSQHLRVAPFLSKVHSSWNQRRNYQIMLWVKGPIFEDGPNFDMVFRVFSRQNGVTIATEIGLVKERGVDNQRIKVVQKRNPDAKGFNW
ncbi:hypothetical protein Tco_1299412, partial [Tanacetum coccineum]